MTEAHLPPVGGIGGEDFRVDTSLKIYSRAFCPGKGGCSNIASPQIFTECLLHVMHFPFLFNGANHTMTQHYHPRIKWDGICGRLNNSLPPPKKKKSMSESSEPMNVTFHTNCLAAVIKLRMRRWEDYHGLSRRTRQNYKGPYNREVRGSGLERESRRMETEVPGEWPLPWWHLWGWLWRWREKPQAKESKRPLEFGKGKEIST